MTETTAASRLVSLGGYAIPVLASAGTEPRARVIAGLADQAFDWLSRVTGKRPEFTLYVAGQADWSTVAEVPIYGMPMSLPGKVVTSPEPATWWRDFLDALRPHLPARELADLVGAYGDPPDFTTMADLVVVHEITHLFHEIDPVTWASEFPADWVMELFANIGMYGFVAEHQSQRLPLLTTLTAAARAVGPASWPLHRLQDMGLSMQTSVSNYVWYEYLLIGFAESIWATGGAEAMRAYQRRLGDPQLTHDQIIRRLTEIDSVVAEAVRAWPA